MLKVSLSACYSWLTKEQTREDQAASMQVVFAENCRIKNHLLQSMSRVDNVYDNAFMESLFNRFKGELLQGGAFQNREDAYTEIFEYIEMYCNTKRRHTGL